ncbi:alpha/beta fold hydrolase [Streptomyces sp. NPDC088794]|uniref:alpha/beta fold hydrolase n=1 Tax=Streptomyces sp. NPDC088794 TaxID=3365902 RepID=UPI0038293059
MPLVEVNGVGLYREVVGDGDPLVLVHGSWDDHYAWLRVRDAFAERFRVLVYDRRGHSRSERPPGQGTRFEDEEDLAALITALGSGPAYVAANSFGASTALGLAARRPELFRGLTVHEPPLLDVVADDPVPLPMITSVRQELAAVLDHLRAGEDLEGARRFMDGIALGPGEWDKLPDKARDTVVANAPTFLDEHGDPAWAALDLDRLAGRAVPLLVTHGTTSPAWLHPIAARLTETLPQARAHVFEGSGHVPHVTSPEEYVDVVTGFVEEIRRAG